MTDNVDGAGGAGKRAVPALLLLLLASGAQAGWRPPEWLWLAPAAVTGALIPFIPLAQATEQEPVGFADGPYTDEAGYLQGSRPWAVTLDGSTQRTVPGRLPATRAGARLDTAKRMGFDVNWTRFPSGELRQPEGADYWTAHLLGNVSEASNQILDWGVGLATLQGEQALWGGGIEADYEWFPQKPFTVRFRYEASMLQDRRVYHDVSGHLGVAWGRLAVSAGWRAFLNPLRASHGPEAALRLRL